MSVSREGCTGSGVGLIALGGVIGAMLAFAGVASAADFVIVGSRTPSGTPNPVAQTPADLPPGRYSYFCRVHPFMRGAFKVE